tara:strand:- start:7541 stop:7711 length:171 start_codon:yes stop_codon:yes gene_type:complete
MKTIKVHYICDLRVAKCEMPNGQVRWFLFDEGDAGRCLAQGSRQEVAAAVQREMGR